MCEVKNKKGGRESRAVKCTQSRCARAVSCIVQAHLHRPEEMDLELLARGLWLTTDVYTTSVPPHFVVQS
ncbi:hypothetical protein DCAR_0415850 [Daucus carota subsp. sativus]|uniref:Uncharacterized protein n=1 Tax=Daucus carota subsp. sativus TaxID=79200 RepID=A0A165WU41_DAUCS|nr:hypothetical protein DCAR_0415850 [Daucus carota subsp. sativus]